MDKESLRSNKDVQAVPDRPARTVLVGGKPLLRRDSFSMDDVYKEGDREYLRRENTKNLEDDVFAIQNTFKLKVLSEVSQQQYEGVLMRSVFKGLHATWVMQDDAESAGYSTVLALQKSKGRTETELMPARMQVAVSDTESNDRLAKLDIRFKKGYPSSLTFDISQLIIAKPQSFLNLRHTSQFYAEANQKNYKNVEKLIAISGGADSLLGGLLKNNVMIMRRNAFVGQELYKEIQYPLMSNTIDRVFEIAGPDKITTQFTNLHIFLGDSYSGRVPEITFSGGSQISVDCGRSTGICYRKDQHLLPLLSEYNPQSDQFDFRRAGQTGFSQNASQAPDSFKKNSSEVYSSDIKELLPQNTLTSSQAVQLISELMDMLPFPQR